MKWLTFNNLLNVLLVCTILYFVGRYIYFLPKYSDGEAAPEFSATLIDGKSFELRSLQGHYVLLDFWASWCGPCRKENPDLVALYQKYQGKALKNDAQFHVVGIGVERNAQRWKAAIQQDNLIWPHHLLDQTTSLKFFNGSISELYGVKKIPTKFLLNPKGEIVLVDPSISEIDQWLSKHQQ